MRLYESNGHHHLGIYISQYVFTQAPLALELFYRKGHLANDFQIVLIDVDENRL
jgi:hypothetical protein